MNALKAESSRFSPASRLELDEDKDGIGLISHAEQHPAPDWLAAVSEFKQASLLKSSWQILNSVVPFCGLWYLMYLSIFWSYWLTLLLAIPTAGLLVRLFIIQHDCGHHSFFRSRAANDFVGRALSVLTLTPYYSWKRDHAAHHASTGSRDRRGRGDVETLTVAEYRASSPLKKLAYRLFRNPLVMVVLG